MSDFSRPLEDFKQQKLCDPCWNGKHWHREIVTNQKGVAKQGTNIIWDCLGLPCQCHCRELYKQQTARRKKIIPDYSQQTVIDTGNDVLTFGNKNTHKDE